MTTYGQIAQAIGRPEAGRAVGNMLNKNKSAAVPCHRVIRSDGKIGGFNRGAQNKKSLLKAEGVEINDGKVVLEQYQVDFARAK